MQFSSSAAPQHSHRLDFPVLLLGQSPPCGYLRLMLPFATLVSFVQTAWSDRASDRSKEMIHVKNKYAYLAKSVSLNVAFDRP